MRKANSFSAIWSLLLAFCILQVPSIGHAQSGADACSQARADFDTAMQSFRSAYFLREDATGTAESVMEDEVEPSAGEIYESCPDEFVAAIRTVVERTKASLSNPRRGELVACDRALISYKSSLSKYDNQVLPGYAEYRNMLYFEIDPAAQEAINACPQMPELAQQTQNDIVERQRRLDRMQDIDNARPTMWENRSGDTISAFESANDAINDN